jgi:parallel beta-helix repeat protein
MEINNFWRRFKKKILIIQILIFICFLLGNPKVISIENDNSTIIISSLGSGNYSSIQRGIDAANPGDTIFVLNGSYNENIVIDLPINLLGENNNNTIIDGRGTGNVIKINADGVTIKGFTIQNSGPIFPNAGINISSDNNYISDNIILNNYYGITIHYSSVNNIIKNTIHNNNHCGIYMSWSVNNNISENSIQNHTYNGIGVYDSSNNTIVENNLSHNEYCGINIRQSSFNTIMGNNFTANNIGIHVPSSENNIGENYFSNNKIDIDRELLIAEYGIIIFTAIVIIFIIIIGFFLKRKYL